MKKQIRVAIPDPVAKENYTNALILAGQELNLEIVPVWLEEKEANNLDPNEYQAMLLPGGADLDPSLYGKNNEGSRGIDRKLDDMQQAAFHAFRKTGKPILGICRGHQLINAALGGTLIQNIPQFQAHVGFQMEMTDPVSGETKPGWVDQAHMIHTEPGSMLERLYGERFRVNSFHHQAVEKVGRGLRITAYSEDGIVEAMEHEGLPIKTVQFHPERMCYAKRREDTIDGKKVIQWLLTEAAGKAEEV